MKRFSYTGRNADGRRVRGQLIALDADDASRRLQGVGVYVTTVIPLSESRRSAPPRVSISEQERLFLVESWAMLLEAGLPMQSALLHLRVRSRRRDVIQAIEWIQQEIDEGATLTEALRTSRLFPPPWIAVLSIGEKGGDIVPVLRMLQQRSLEYQRFRRELVSMMTMPSILLVAAMVWAATFLLKVIPGMALLLSQTGATAFSHWLQVAAQTIVEGMQWFILSIAALFFVAWLFRHKGYGINFFQVWLPSSIPLLGSILSQIQLITIVSSIRLQLESKVSLVDALETLSAATSHRALRHQLSLACRRLKEGVPVPQALSCIEAIPPVGHALVATGNISGKLPDMFAFLERDAQSALVEGVKRLTTLLRILSIVVCGVLVGFLIITYFGILFAGLSNFSPQQISSQTYLSVPK